MHESSVREAFVEQAHPLTDVDVVLEAIVVLRLTTRPRGTRRQREGPPGHPWRDRERSCSWRRPTRARGQSRGRGLRRDGPSECRSHRSFPERPVAGAVVRGRRPASLRERLGSAHSRLARVVDPRLRLAFLAMSVVLARLARSRLASRFSCVSSLRTAVRRDPLRVRRPPLREVLGVPIARILVDHHARVLAMLRTHPSRSVVTTVPTRATRSA